MKILVLAALLAAASGFAEDSARPSLQPGKMQAAEPSVAITAPLSGGFFAPGENLTITADASDSDGKVAKVEFYQGVTKLGEDTQAPYEYTWNAVPTGNYWLRAVVTDDDENRATTFPFQVTVARTAEEMRSPVNQVFQWKVEDVETGWSKGQNEKLTISHLWIPEDCERVNGVLVMCLNIPEHVLVGHQKVRDLCREHGLAIFWGTKSFYDFQSKEEEKIVQLLEKILAMLADKSGYDELATAPWVPLGESGHQLMVKAVMAKRPERTIAGVGLKDPVIIQNNDLTVPALGIFGTAHEWNQEEKNFHEIWNGDYQGGELKAYRTNINTHNANRTWPSSLVLDPESGHFCMSERVVDYVVDWLRAVIPMRLDLESPGKPLRPIDFAATFRADLPHRDDPLDTPVPPFAANGPGEGFWFPTAELAERAQSWSRINWNMKSQLAGVKDTDGQEFRFERSGIPKVFVNRAPDNMPGAAAARLEDDGITFELVPFMYDTFPDEFVINAGEKLQQAPGTPVIEWVGGGVEPLGNNRFRLAPDRTSVKDGTFMAVRQPGTDSIRGVSTPFPLVATSPGGKATGQRIVFRGLPSVPVGTETMTLSATSTAGLPVRYYVNSGPAIVIGNVLYFSEIPPRARFPVDVEVVAWQNGTTAGDGVRRAKPVHRTFQILTEKQYEDYLANPPSTVVFASFHGDSNLGGAATNYTPLNSGAEDTTPGYDLMARATMQKGHAIYRAGTAAPGVNKKLAGFTVDLRGPQNEFSGRSGGVLPAKTGTPWNADQWADGPVQGGSLLRMSTENWPDDNNTSDLGTPQSGFRPGLNWALLVSNEGDGIGSALDRDGNNVIAIGIEWKDNDADGKIDTGDHLFLRYVLGAATLDEIDSTAKLNAAIAGRGNS